MATIGLRREVQLTPLPCPPYPETASFADSIPVPFGYTLRVPNWAGPICAEKERLKSGSISALVRLES